MQRRLSRLAWGPMQRRSIVPAKLIALALLLIVVMLLIWVLYGELIAARIARARKSAPDNDPRREGDRLGR